MKIGFLICGPSGVGKTSNVEKMLKNAGINKKLKIVDPDQIQANTHAEQSNLALLDVVQSIRQKKSFVYVATCGGTRAIGELVDYMKQQGFRTIVAIPYTSLSIALSRIENRTEQPVPEEVVKDLHQFFKRKAERYMTMPNLDEVYLYNNEKDFNLLLERKSNKIVCSGPSNFYFDISKYC
jgi:predicted ABC-type ATPase